MQNTEERKSYQQIFKATSVFGGVQIFSIIINLFKSKIIALFLGPEGMGIYSLLQNPITLISQITGLGISTSGIRDIAKANTDSNEVELSKTIVTVKRWTRITGCIGLLFTLVFAEYISYWTFGDAKYTTDFRVLSIVLLVTSLSNENDVILRGTRRIKDIAKAGVLSSLLSLLISFPLYYFLGLKGIVPVIIFAAVFLCLFNRFYAHKVQIVKCKLSNKETFIRGKGMAALGIMIVLSTVIETLTMYVTNSFIRSYGTIADVGLFQAGMQITNVSIGLVYTAMAGDYYPRLSSICENRTDTIQLVNQQAEIATLISTPILLCMMTFTPLLIRIFLSSDFIPVSNLIHWILFAAVFRASTWTLNYVVLARGDTRLYFILVLFVNLMLFVFYNVGYRYFGLEGLGLGYLLMVLINALAIYNVIKRKYLITFSITFKRLLILSVVSCLLSLFVVKVFSGLLMYSINIVIIVIVSIVCFIKLNNRIKFVDFLFRK